MTKRKTKINPITRKKFIKKLTLQQGQGGLFLHIAKMPKRNYSTIIQEPNLVS